MSYALQFYSVKEITVNRLVSPRPAELLERFGVRVMVRPLKWSECVETRFRRRSTRLAFPAPCSLQPHSSSPITNTRYSSSGPSITLCTLLPVQLMVKPIGMWRRLLKVDGRLGSLWLSCAVLASNLSLSHQCRPFITERTLLGLLRQVTTTNTHPPELGGHRSSRPVWPHGIDYGGELRPVFNSKSSA